MVIVNHENIKFYLYTRAEFSSTGIPPVVNVFYKTRDEVIIYVYLLVVVGVALSLVCLIFNVVFRNKKYA